MSRSCWSTLGKTDMDTRFCTFNSKLSFKSHTKPRLHPNLNTSKSLQCFEHGLQQGNDSTATVNVPSNADCISNQTDSCEGIVLTCTWQAGDGMGSPWQMVMEFFVVENKKNVDLCATSKQEDWDSFKYEVKGLGLTYCFDDVDDFPDAKETGKTSCNLRIW